MLLNSSITDPLSVYDILALFWWCYDKMRTTVITYGNFTFSLQDVFEVSIFFSWIGWVFYKCMHIMND